MEFLTVLNLYPAKMNKVSALYQSPEVFFRPYEFARQKNEIWECQEICPRELANLGLRAS